MEKDYLQGSGYLISFCPSCKKQRKCLVVKEKAGVIFELCDECSNPKDSREEGEKTITIYLREKEARKKFCPFSNFMCVASECAMWRWSEDIKELCLNAKKVGTVELVKDTWVGFCGLGGKPK